MIDSCRLFYQHGLPDGAREMEVTKDDIDSALRYFPDAAEPLTAEEYAAVFKKLVAEHSDSQCCPTDELIEMMWYMLFDGQLRKWHVPDRSRWVLMREKYCKIGNEKLKEALIGPKIPDWPDKTAIEKK